MKAFVIKATVEKIIRDIKTEDVTTLMHAMNAQHVVASGITKRLLTNVLETVKENPDASKNIANIIVGISELIECLKPAVQTAIEDIEEKGLELAEDDSMKAWIARIEELIQ